MRTCGFGVFLSVILQAGRQAERLRRPVRSGPRGWRLWTAPPHVIAYVLAVDAAALGVVCGTARLVGPRPDDLLRLAVLAAGCLVHLEAARGIERLREVAADGTPCTNLTSMWIFAGLLLLPPPFVVALVLLTYLHAWLRVPGTVVPHRAVFSAATMVLAGAAAGALLAAAPDPAGHPAVPAGPLGVAVLLGAMVTWWLVNHALMVGATLLATPATTARRVLGHLPEQLVVGAALGLGVAIAVLVTVDPWLVPVLLLTVLAVHRGLLLHQFERAARTDPKTGLLNANSWHEAAAGELARCRRTGGSLGVLMIDLDHFKRINDRHGHLAGDRVLRATAEALRGEVRPGDLVGRFGGEEFVVALPGVGTAELAAVADRICLRVRRLTVDPGRAGPGHGGPGHGGPGHNGQGGGDLTCSIGAARHPESGATLDALVLAADDALFLAKDSGRDRVCLMGAARSVPAEQ